jgi:hypothetical protein
MSLTVHTALLVTRLLTGWVAVHCPAEAEMFRFAKISSTDLGTVFPLFPVFIEDKTAEA